MDKATIRALRDLLLIIYDEQKSDWSGDSLRGRKPSNVAKEFYERYGYTNWNQVKETEFEKWLRLDETTGQMNVRFSDRKAILFLPPLEKDEDFVPILNMECKVGESINSMSLYVLLVQEREEGREPRGLAFRFESPENEHYEEDSNEGLHDFYHVQFIKGFEYGPEFEIPQWVPMSQPSFPLLANDPLTLVFALLMTLYGKKYCWDFYNRHVANLPELESSIQKLHAWVKWSGLEKKK